MKKVEASPTNGTIFAPPPRLKIPCSLRACTLQPHPIPANCRYRHQSQFAQSKRETRIGCCYLGSNGGRGNKRCCVPSMFTGRLALAEQATRLVQPCACRSARLGRIARTWISVRYTVWIKSKQELQYIELCRAERRRYARLATTS